MREGRLEFLSQFPSLATAGDAGAACPTRRPRDLRALQARPRASAQRHAEPATPCTATCCGCAARTRSSARQGNGRLDGAVLGPEAFVLRFFGENAGRPPAAGQPGRRTSHLEPVLGAAAGPPDRPALGGPLVERGPALRRHRRAAAGRRGRMLAPARPGRGGDAAGGPGGKGGEETMNALARSMPWPEPDAPAQPDVPAQAQPASLLSREWLVTNGLGGYASGTVAGVPTRRYHGLLVAAPARARSAAPSCSASSRRCSACRTAPSSAWAASRRPGSRPTSRAPGTCGEFRLEAGLPVWRYEAGGFRLEKRVFLGHLQNTVHVIYRLALGEGRLRLELHPTVHFRPHDAPVSTPLGGPYSMNAVEHRYEFCSPWPSLPSLRVSIQGTAPHLHRRRRARSRTSTTRSRTAAATNRWATSGARASSASTWRPGRTTPRWSPRPSPGTW